MKLLWYIVHRAAKGQTPQPPPGMAATITAPKPNRARGSTGSAASLPLLPADHPHAQAMCTGIPAAVTFCGGNRGLMPGATPRSNLMWANSGSGQHATMRPTPVAQLPHTTHQQNSRKLQEWIGAGQRQHRTLDPVAVVVQTPCGVANTSCSPICCASRRPHMRPPPLSLSNMCGPAEQCICMCFATSKAPNMDTGRDTDAGVAYQQT